MELILWEDDQLLQSRLLLQRMDHVCFFHLLMVSIIVVLRNTGLIHVFFGSTRSHYKKLHMLLGLSFTHTLAFLEQSSSKGHHSKVQRLSSLEIHVTSWRYQTVLPHDPMALPWVYWLYINFTPFVGTKAGMIKYSNNV